MRKYEDLAAAIARGGTVSFRVHGTTVKARTEEELKSLIKETGGKVPASAAKSKPANGATGDDNDAAEKAAAEKAAAAADASNK